VTLYVIKLPDTIPISKNATYIASCETNYNDRLNYSFDCHVRHVRFKVIVITSSC